MDALHPQLLTALDVFDEIVHKDSLIWIHPGLLQRNLKYLCIRLGHTDLGRDDHVFESIIVFMGNDVLAQIVPGIRDQSNEIV